MSDERRAHGYSNPIFGCMVAAAAGLALAVPHALSIAAAVVMVVGVEVQVRRVEEPYLLRQHGDAYRAYLARAGRFVPGVGRIPATASRGPG
jgi:protein-S-isoprenylcysteine O-methyltransferase Ste14